ncbi:hypothetical protein BS17DRAFT_58823 [Gyrodon lividus]|nr:hypothetical protein BS17DRAFT_58823 [Gyrodon lividus]
MAGESMCTNFGKERKWRVRRYSTLHSVQVVRCQQEWDDRLPCLHHQWVPPRLVTGCLSLVVLRPTLSSLVCCSSPGCHIT